MPYFSLPYTVQNMPFTRTDDHICRSTTCSKRGFTNETGDKSRHDNKYKIITINGWMNKFLVEEPHFLIPSRPQNRFATSLCLQQPAWPKLPALEWSRVMYEQIGWGDLWSFWNSQQPCTAKAKFTVRFHDSKNINPQTTKTGNHQYLEFIIPRLFGISEVRLCTPIGNIIWQMYMR